MSTPFDFSLPRKKSNNHMEIKNNTKVRQNLNTKVGKIAKISKGRSVTIVLERCDARKEQKKAVNKLRAVKIILENDAII